MEINHSRIRRRLRFFLGFAALAWGVSIYGVVATWPAAENALQGLGAKPIAYDPMLDYWLRMAAGAFTLVGGLYLVLMVWPDRHLHIIPWFGALMLLEGAILLVTGLRLGLPALPFYGDTAACFVGGTGILFYSRRLALLAAEPLQKRDDGKDADRLDDDDEGGGHR